MKDFSFKQDQKSKDICNYSTRIRDYRTRGRANSKTDLRVQEIKQKYGVNPDRTPSTAPKIGPCSQTPSDELTIRIAFTTPDSGCGSKINSKDEKIIAEDGKLHLKMSKIANDSDKNCENLLSLKGISQQGEEVIFKKLSGNQRSRGIERALKAVGSSQILDPRVNNIDRINSKIKQILNCLQQNDHHHKRKEISHPNNQPDNSHNSHDFICGLQSSSEAIPAKANIPLSTILKNPDLSKLYSTCTPPVNSVWKNGQRYTHPPSETEKILTTNLTDADDKENVQSAINQRNTENMPSRVSQSFSHQNYNSHQLQESKGTQETVVSRENIKEAQRFHDEQKICKEKMTNISHLVSKVDRQIDTITTKILLFQEEKRKLEIDFKPFVPAKFSTSSNRHRARSELHTKQNQNYLNSQEPPPKIPDFLSHQNSSLVNRFTINDNPDLHFMAIGVDSHSRNQPTKQNLCQNLPKQSPTSGDHNSQAAEAKGKKETMSRAQSCMMRVHAPELAQKVTFSYKNMEERKKIVQYSQEPTKPYHNILLKLARALGVQAELDLNLRSAKFWFQNIEGADKWVILGEAGKKIGGREQSLSEWRTSMGIEEGEVDPFFGKGDEGSMERVVKCWEQAREHWEKKICKQFDIPEGILSEMDLSKKGYLEIEDILRFTNYTAGAFFRKRDFLLIFKRLTDKQNLTFENFHRILCA